MPYLIMEDEFRNFETANMFIQNLKNTSQLIFDLNVFSTPTQLSISYFVYSSCYLFLINNHKIKLLNASDYFLQILGKYENFDKIFDIDMLSITITKKEATLKRLTSYLSHSYIFSASNIKEHSQLCTTIKPLINSLLSTNSTLSAQLFDVIKEIMGNSLEHSVVNQTLDFERYGKYIVIFNIYKSELNQRNSLLDIHVFDAGVGIRYNIEYICGTLSNQDIIYISEAIKPGVTSRKNKEGGSGLSSTIDIFSLIKSDRKYLDIVSGRGRYRNIYSSNNGEKPDLLNTIYTIQGTYINLGILI